MAGPDRELVAAVRGELAVRGDPSRAPAMQAYMKSALPFRGVPSPLQRQLYRALFGGHPPADRDVWQATVLALWREAAFREERYAAIALTGWPGAAGWQEPAALPLYDELIVTGAWWDFVDDIATHRIGPLLRRHPGQLRPVILRWSSDQDRWRRRTAVICQVGLRQETDVALLTACIRASIADRDFFLRKAIGWALRSYAKTDPDWVRQFVAAHADELSPLSRREALKHLG